MGDRSSSLTAAAATSYGKAKYVPSNSQVERVVETISDWKGVNEDLLLDMVLEKL